LKRPEPPSLKLHRHKSEVAELHFRSMAGQLY
jgi:hypothetical protein